MKFKSLLTGVLLAFGLGTAASAADVKVGFVYVGPIGDYGWTHEHDKGRLAVEEHFGDRVETIYQESVAYGADAERVITTMAMQALILYSLLHLDIWTQPLASPKNFQT
jgi:simple sugar transport system substrate-binding protein